MSEGLYHRVVYKIKKIFIITPDILYLTHGLPFIRIWNPGTNYLVVDITFLEQPVERKEIYGLILFIFFSFYPQYF